MSKTFDRPTADDRPEDARKPAPTIAIASLILSMWLVAIGNGLMFAYIPIRLSTKKFNPT